MVRFMETESRVVVPRSWQEGEKGSCLMGIECGSTDKRYSGVPFHNLC